MNLTQDPYFNQTVQNLHDEVIRSLQARKELIGKLETKDFITEAIFTLAANICIDKRNRIPYNDSSDETEGRTNYYKIVMKHVVDKILPFETGIDFNGSIILPVDELLKEYNYKEIINNHFNQLFGNEGGNIL